MTSSKTILLSAALGVALAANAWPQYQVYPYGQAPAAPPAWSYDPYTSGLGPCPQRYPTDPPCSETIEPSYGQPSFWPSAQ